MQLTVYLLAAVAVFNAAVYATAGGHAPDTLADIHKANEDLFHDLLPEEELKKEEDVYYFFSLHNQNHDDYLDGHELRAAFASEDLEEDLDYFDQWVEQVLERFDVDKDGRLSRDEYFQTTLHDE